jgi:hypothetical protein
VKLDVVVSSFHTKSAQNADSMAGETPKQHTERQPEAIIVSRRAATICVVFSGGRLDVPLANFDSTEQTPGAIRMFGSYGESSTNYETWFEKPEQAIELIPCVTSYKYEPFLIFQYCQTTPPFPETVGINSFGCSFFVEWGFVFIDWERYS